MTGSMLEKICVMTNNRISSETRKKNFSSLFPSFEIVQNMRIGSLYYNHHHHSSFSVLGLPPIFSIVFPLFIDTIDNRIELKREDVEEDTNICLYLARNKKEEEKDLSFDTITNLLDCRSIQLSSKRKYMFGKLFFIFSIVGSVDTQLRYSL